jgi:hypothetical protein
MSNVVLGETNWQLLARFWLYGTLRVLPDVTLLGS